MTRLIKLNYYILFIAFFLGGCVASNNSTSAYLSKNTIFIREEPGGIYVVKAFGTGYTQQECIENAMFNSMKEIIFKGIIGALEPKPLLGGANPEFEYKDYFTNFFSKEGLYKNFVFKSNRGNIDKDDRFEVRSGPGISKRRITSRRSSLFSVGVELKIKKSDLQIEFENSLLKK